MLLQRECSNHVMLSSLMKSMFRKMLIHNPMSENNQNIFSIRMLVIIIDSHTIPISAKLKNLTTAN